MSENQAPDSAIRRDITITNSNRGPMTAVPPPDPALRSALAFLCDYVKTLRHTEAVADCLHCNLNYVLRKTGEAVERTAVPPKKCEPVWGSCNLPSGHEGRHDAYAEWPAAVPPPDPIARLRELAERLQHLGGAGGHLYENHRELLIESADALARLQAEKDQLTEYMESARVGYDAEKEARQKAMATVDRLQQERDDWKESRGEWVDRALQAEQKRDDLQAIVDCLTAEHDEYRRDQQQYLFHLEGAVDRLTAALRDYVDWFGAAHEGTCPADDTCACSCAGINDAVNAALAPADLEVKT